ncbi:membrane integrity-associated transporter subunit PqiC [Pseudaminobacter sp. 19-2017]|uniref:Membrane integrity-associated transporter subunit PqiC n=1 Tax=Pseudaminobacter soli (ex Zhang et al. 2022) TaxID=2831468 RepID=A0A942E1X6_9HYPH|nr:ABC-type transport auxiliary lipoprotein family protein [Pseudaminobacter soli]MBS3647067.1 membrane integrity-associated transporter subunit PqiC [Pseudaminobacter soli]
MKYLTASSAILLLATAIGGCALLPGGGPAPLDTFELSAPEVPIARTRSSTQILIAEPAALKSLDGQNIVIESGPGDIQFLKGAQWSDRLPRIVQSKLAESFQESQAFKGVGLPGQRLAIDYQIVTEIRTFSVRVNGQRAAQVELFVKVLNDRNGTVRSSKVFSAMAPVSGSGNEAYKLGLDAAFNEAGSEIVRWVESQLVGASTS